MRQTFLLILTGLLVQGKILATSVIPPTWEHLATTSEFIGLVECVTAGGIVARHRVIESWKGAEVGIEMNISQNADAFGPQFPISLVGERFLVFADTKSSYNISSITSGGGIPLWWRKIPVDLKCFSLIPLKEPFSGYLSQFIIGIQSDGLAEFKADVTNFLRSDKEVQEWRLMLAASRKHLYLPPPDPTSAAGKRDMQLFESLQETANVEELWQRIITHASGLVVPAVPQTSESLRDQRHAAILLSILREGGRGKCLELLEKSDPSKLPWNTKNSDQLASHFRRNISADDGKPEVRATPHESSPKPPTPHEIAEAKDLLSKSWDDQTGSAFEGLCRHDPASAVPFLLEWRPPEERGDSQYGYLLGSAFGHLCPADRVTHLKALLSAKDDWIRTSAAVYLCFDDRKQGKDALRKASLIESDAGAWAALVLASKGEKSAILRALKVFETRDDETRSAIHRNLQDRLRVLLSNSAYASGVPQPPPPPKDSNQPAEHAANQTEWHRSLVRWWQVNQANIILMDPWAKILEEQRVD